MTGGRRARLVVGVLLTLAVAGLCAAAVQRGVLLPADRTSYSSRTLPTPVGTTLRLGAGRYLVVEDTGPQRDPEDPFSAGERPITVAPGDVTLVAVRGDRVVKVEATGRRTTNRGTGHVHEAVASFRIVRPGVHTLGVASAGSEISVVKDGWSTAFGRDLYALRPLLLAAPVGLLAFALLASVVLVRPVRPFGPAVPGVPG